MPFLGVAIFLVWLVLLLRFPRVMLPVSGVLAGLGLLLGLVMGLLQRRLTVTDVNTECPEEMRSEGCHHS